MLLNATRQALDAAATGDIETLEIALAARQAALENAAVAERIKAFRGGEAVQVLVCGIKRRLNEELARLEQIKTGLARSAEPRAAKIDLRA